MQTPQGAPPEPHPRRAGLLRRTIRWGGVALWVTWAALSTAVVAVAVIAWTPRYEATAWLEVIKPAHRPILGGEAAAVDVRVLLGTRVQLLKSPAVLERALSDPALRALPRIRKAPDPVAELRRVLRVETLPDTALILVSMESRSPDEPATIVNAVVQSDLTEVGSRADREARDRVERLREMWQRLNVEVVRRRERLTALLKKQAEDVQLRRGDPYRVTLHEYRQLKGELNRTQIERIKAESRLRLLRQQLRGKPGDAASGEQIEGLLAQVESSRAVEKALTEKLDALTVESQPKGDGALEAQFARADLDNSQQMLLAIDKRLQQLELDSGDGPPVRLVSPARVSPAPASHGWRLAILVAIPLLLLPLVVGLFLLVQVRAERIAAALRPGPEAPPPA